MSEFQMTHVALVGARIESFEPLGFNSRSELSLRRALPTSVATPEKGRQLSYSAMEQEALEEKLSSEFPLWVHNAIADPEFPQRSRLTMALRRFEGELRDNRSNEVIAAVLSAGFKNQQFDPLVLPKNMPLRQRCSMLMQISIWQDAYRHLEREFITILAENADELDIWLATSSPEIEQAIAV